MEHGGIVKHKGEPAVLNPGERVLNAEQAKKLSMDIALINARPAKNTIKIKIKPRLKSNELILIKYGLKKFFKKIFLPFAFSLF